MNPRALHLLGLIVLLLGAGCSTPREIPPSRAELESMSVQDIADQVPVLRVMRFEQGNKRSGGSALRLSDRTILLTDHQVRNEDGGALSGEGWVSVEGTLNRYTLKASGGETSQKDWAVLELEHPLPPSSITIATDFNRRLEPGTEILIVGYFFFSSPLQMTLSEEEFFSSPRLALPSVVIRRPIGEDRSANALYIKSVAKGSIYGASGGAVVMKDPQTGHLVAVGTLSTVITSTSGRFRYTIASRMCEPTINHN